MTEFRRTVLRALGWSAGVKFIGQFVSIIFGIILARMLVPDDFGLIAMVMVFAGFAYLLTDVGLGSALVQKQNIESIHYTTVFWTNLSLGAFIALVFYVCAPLLAEFYHREEIELIAQILSIQFIVGALALVPRYVLVKNLDFRVISLADFFGMIVGGAIGIIMAYRGFGLWSLVSQLLANSIFSALVIWINSRWLPELKYSKSALKEMFAFSFFVFATNSVQHSTRQLDKLLSGKFLGGEAAGLLDKAQSMMLFPVRNISHVVGSVMFPALSQIQGDLERTRKVYLMSIRAIAFVTFPMMAGIFSVAESFTLGILGQQWADMIPILRILCFAGVASSIVSVTGAVYLSQGKSKLDFKVNLLTRPIAIIGVSTGIFWGVTGVALGFTLSLWINTLITLSVAGSLIGVNLVRLAALLKTTFLISLIMGWLVLEASMYLSIDSQLNEFLLLTIFGAIVYVVLTLIFNRKDLSMVVSALGLRTAKS
jgi:PST family polysaccharide transporter